MLRVLDFDVWIDMLRVLDFDVWINMLRVLDLDVFCRKSPNRGDGVPAHQELRQAPVSLSHHWQPGEAHQDDEDWSVEGSLRALFSVDCRWDSPG